MQSSCWPGSPGTGNHVHFFVATAVEPPLCWTLHIHCIFNPNNSAGWYDYQLILQGRRMGVRVAGTRPRVTAHIPEQGLALSLTTQTVGTERPSLLPGRRQLVLCWPELLSSSSSSRSCERRLGLKKTSEITKPPSHWTLPSSPWKQCAFCSFSVYLSFPDCEMGFNCLPSVTAT